MSNTKLSAGVIDKCTGAQPYQPLFTLARSEGKFYFLADEEVSGVENNEFTGPYDNLGECMVQARIYAADCPTADDNDWDEGDFNHD